LNAKDDRAGDGIFTTIKFGVMALLSVPLFLWLDARSLPLGLLVLNHLLVILGAYAVGDAIARRFRPLPD